MKASIPRWMFWISATLLLGHCDTPDFPPSKYARVNTLPVGAVSADGVVLKGELVYPGTVELVSHGFIYGTKPTLKETESLQVNLGPLTGTGVFEGVVGTGLYPDSIYYVKAFARTATVTVFGKVETFTSEGSGAPLVQALDPPEGTGGDTIVVRGKGLNFQPSKTIIRFGTNFYGESIGNTDTTIRVIVPRNIPAASVPVAVILAGKTGMAPAPFLLQFPEIASISPAELTFDDILTIQGSRFDPAKELNKVWVDGLPMQVVQASADQLQVKVSSAGISRRENQLVVQVDQRADTADMPVVMKAPVIASLSPLSGLTGSTVQITGNYFNPIAAGNQVLLGGRPVQVLTASPTVLSVKIPAQIIADARIQTMQVIAAGQSAVSGQSFELTDPWLRKADIPFPPFGISGGVGFVMEAKLIFGLGTLTPAGQFLEFDPIQNSWSPRTLSPLGTRYNATSFVIGSKAYVGLGNDNNNNPLDDFWSFDPATDQWTPVADFPFGTTSALGFSWSGSGYVITRAATSNFWKYDPVADSWSALPDFEGNNTPPGYIPHVLDAAFVLGDKLYALAVDYTTGPEEFYVFDFVSGQWTRLADVGTPFVSYGLTGFSALGAGYLHGAIGVIKYEPGTDTWISVANSLGGTNAKAFVIDDKVYVIAGHSWVQFWEYNPLYQ